jgi:hypothetical protein
MTHCGLFERQPAGLSINDCDSFVHSFGDFDMYRIFTIGDDSVVRMLDEGPWQAHVDALTFANAEVSGSWFILDVSEPVPATASSDTVVEKGWMRVYHNGVHLGDTPLQVLSDGTIQLCDGSYGLLDHLEDEDFPDFKDVCSQIESDALDLFQADRCAMLRRFDYSVIYIPGENQSL